jgi:hypothetical protein
MVIAGGLAITLAIAVAAVTPRLIASDSVLAAQLALVFALPVSAIGNVALRATRGSSQVVLYVVARSVTEPLLFLAAGLLLRSRCDGSIALPISLMVSVAGGTAVAGFGLVRAYRMPVLIRALRRVREWPVRELVHTSVPLGLADVLQAAQSRLDLIAVALITFSPMAIASYAIATEIASVFVAVRIGVDQIVAPLAVDSRRNRIQLGRLISIASRWTCAIAVVLAFLVLAAPDHLLSLFGGSERAVLVLFVLVLGRAVELAFSPAASMLAMIGEPKLSLLAAATGLAFAASGQIAATILGLTPVAIAVSSAGGVAIAGALAAYLLSATVRSYSQRTSSVAAS